MKKVWMVLGLSVLLAGCGAEVTMETVADELVQAASARQKTIQVELPEEAVLPVMETDNGKLYLCKDYDVQIQTLDGGDLDETIRTVTGHDAEELTVMQTDDGTNRRSEFVWSAVGEPGELLCRAAVVDDGNYHYVLCATIGAEKAEQYRQIWNGMFASFGISETPDIS